MYIICSLQDLWWRNWKEESDLQTPLQNKLIQNGAMFDLQMEQEEGLLMGPWKLMSRLNGNLPIRFEGTIGNLA